MGLSKFWIWVTYNLLLLSSCLMIFQIQIHGDFNCRTFMNFQCEIGSKFQKWNIFQMNIIVCLSYLYHYTKPIYNKQIIKCQRRIENETFYSYTLNIIGVCGSLMNAKFNFLSTLNDSVFNQTRIDSPPPHSQKKKTLISDHTEYV